MLPHLYARRVAALTPGPSRAAPRRRRQRAPACAIRPAGAAGAIGATSGLGKPVSRDRAASRDCMACTTSFGVPSGTCVVILTRYSTVTSSSSERLPRSMSPLRAAFSVVYGPPPLRPCNTLGRGAGQGGRRRRCAQEMALTLADLGTSSGPRRLGRDRQGAGSGFMVNRRGRRVRKRPIGSGPRPPHRPRRPRRTASERRAVGHDRPRAPRAA